MKPFKIAAMALVAGAGLALVGAQASADTACGSTSCTATTSAEVSAGVSSGEESSSSTTAAQGTIGTGTTSTTTNDGSTITLGGTSSTGDTTDPLFNDRFNSASFAFGNIKNHSEEWRKQGASTESSSGGSGESLAAVFVFGQNIVVHDGELRNDSGTNDTAGITGSFNSVAGVALVNQSAAVGAQQANLFATVAELNGSSTGPNSGSNAINVTDAQNLIVTADSEVENEEYVHPQTCIAAGNPGAPCATTSQVQPTGDVAGITGSFGTVAGAVAVNQTVGVANQQVNSIMMAH
jgi:hypothetical protein